MPRRVKNLHHRLSSLEEKVAEAIPGAVANALGRADSQRYLSFTVTSDLYVHVDQSHLTLDAIVHSDNFRSSVENYCATRHM